MCQSDVECLECDHSTTKKWLVKLVQMAHNLTMDRWRVNKTAQLVLDRCYPFHYFWILVVVCCCYFLLFVEVFCCLSCLLLLFFFPVAFCCLSWCCLSWVFFVWAVVCCCYLSCYFFVFELLFFFVVCSVHFLLFEMLFVAVVWAVVVFYAIIVLFLLLSVDACHLINQ